MKMKLGWLATFFLASVSLIIIISFKQKATSDPINGILQVKIMDDFWGPKLEKWRPTTVNDVFNKFDGSYHPRQVHLSGQL